MLPSHPTYALEDIQAQMDRPSQLYAKRVARDGIRDLGMDYGEVVQVIQGLTPNHFYKSMPSNTRPGAKDFDVYHATYEGKDIYIKFQEESHRFIFDLVSFKEK